ncbi:hypothetical protein RHMOL_Rhmol08G0282100 [Rhododendron molle]|uniref:Uncharacterized protein n=1 Tax=Rhododendron molle TaxID=49168 RepID=A0ACC0MVC3_RHOML|nr:hypothetical protein RHMOL_Rhmol08G0282100 [Rhododendron molle]
MGKFRLDSVPLVSFGFDSSSKQYKVVNIYRVMKQSTCGELESSHCECEIFTLGSLSWRKIDIIPPASHFEFGADGICLGGVIHWRNFSSDDSRTVHDEVVVAFDLKDERFGVISLPRGPSCMPHLVELGGHLAACEELPENEVEELWILEDYDNWVWVKERIMLPPDCVGPNRFIQTNGSIQTGRGSETHEDYGQLKIWRIDRKLGVAGSGIRESCSEATCCHFAAPRGLKINLNHTILHLAIEYLPDADAELPVDAAAKEVVRRCWRTQSCRE